jgi:hypothetical protein
VAGALAALVLASIFFTFTTLEAQRRRGGFRNLPRSSEWVYDGAFVYCRVAYNSSQYGDGGGWATDYPQADLNLPWRTGQLTTVPVSRDGRGEPNHVIVTLDDPNLFQCPMLIMIEVGSAYFDENDAAILRSYLDKGGFLWVDDFWGEYAWQVWAHEIGKVFPGIPIQDVPLEHPLFSMVYHVKTMPQIPSINHYLSTGNTSERGADSAVPHARAIMDESGRIKVLMTHNTDFGDAFEREGESQIYFDRFAAEGYAFGVNVIVYAMTH